MFGFAYDLGVIRIAQHEKMNLLFWLFHPRTRKPNSKQELHTPAKPPKPNNP
jgi:hypothetical protein